MRNFKAVKPSLLDRAVAYFDPVSEPKRLRAKNAFTLMALTVERTAGRGKGTLETWLHRRLNKWREDRQRKAVSCRNWWWKGPGRF